jgi:hypothetical protein
MKPRKPKAKPKSKPRAKRKLKQHVATKVAPLAAAPELLELPFSKASAETLGVQPNHQAELAPTVADEPSAAASPAVSPEPQATSVEVPAIIPEPPPETVTPDIPGESVQPDEVAPTSEDLSGEASDTIIEHAQLELRELAENFPVVPESLREFATVTASPDVSEEDLEIADSTEPPSEIEIPHMASSPEKQLGAEFAKISDNVAELSLTPAVASDPSAIEDSSSDLDSIYQIEVEIEDSAKTANLAELVSESVAGSAVPQTNIYDGTELPVIPIGVSTIVEGSALPRPAAKGADRRAHPRYPFSASLEVLTASADARVTMQVRDLSQQGCYVDTSAPLPLGTTTELRITKGPVTFAARARAVFNQPAKGMGLMFVGVEPSQLKILDAWIAESRESSWRAINRRRSQRVMMHLPVRISGKNADSLMFEEETSTLAISAHGALVVLKAPVFRGQRFILLNLQTKSALECIVVYIEKIAGEPTQVGMEFMLPNPSFWRVAFPPKDWTPRHPDAKSGRKN